VKDYPSMWSEICFNHILGLADEFENMSEQFEKFAEEPNTDIDKKDLETTKKVLDALLGDHYGNISDARDQLHEVLESQMSSDLELEGFTFESCDEDNMQIYAEFSQGGGSYSMLDVLEELPGLVYRVMQDD